MLVVLKSQGLNKKVLLMGFDASKPLLDAIREGDIIGSILQDPYRMGYLATWFSVRGLKGEDVSVNRSHLSLSTGEYLVTRENVDTAFVQGLFDKEVQANRSTESLRRSPEAKP
jgi:ribose transport system substrate-binding protein